VFHSSNINHHTTHAKEIQNEKVTNKPVVEVILKLEGTTVQGKPKVVSAENTSAALYENVKNVMSLELEKTGENTWRCHAVEGLEYVIGWIAKKGWFEKRSKMFGYCSEPFTAREGLIVKFSPGMPATFEYDLRNPPNNIQVFPANVYLLKQTLKDGKHSYLSWGGNKVIKKPGVVKITGLAMGTYQISAQTSDSENLARSRTPFLYDRRKVEIQSGVVNRFEPIYPQIDTAVEKGDVTIRGIMYGTDKKPVPNKKVQLIPNNDRGPMLDLYYPAVITDSNGRFEFTGVRPELTFYVECSDGSAFIGKESLEANSFVSVDLMLGLKTLPVTMGQPIRDMMIDWKEGGTGKFSDLAGKTVVVDVWATWCAPCIRALPELNSLAAEFSKRSDITFLVLSTDADRAIWEKTVDQSGWNALRHGWLDRKKNSFVFNKPIPYTVIIDKNGIVRAEGNGFDIRGELEKIVKSKNSIEN